VTEGKAASTGANGEAHTWQSRLNSRKRGNSTNPSAQPPIQPLAKTTLTPPACPDCGATKIWRDGFRYNRANGNPVQRWLCTECGYRFSESSWEGSEESQHHQKVHRQSLNYIDAIPFPRQVCVLAEDSKNLATVETRQENPTREGTTLNADVKGKVVEYAWWMQKQGYAPESIRGNQSCLRALQTRNADLLNPESVKEVLAREARKAENGEKGWSSNRRRNVINAYTLFLKFNGLQWEKPRCNVTRKIPFIPQEKEIDDLIAGCPKQVATFLQLLKETAMRSGEAKRLQWTDIDFERRVITLNEPEKNSLPRIWNSLSPKLLAMLNALPHTSLKVFGESSLNSMKATFGRARRRLAAKLQNPRLLQIHFHTLRHWRATMEYHKTRDFLHVKAFLGHKRGENTELYVQIEEKLFQETDDDFTIQVAHNVEEAVKLGEIGFQPFDVIDGIHLYRKRK